MIKNIRAFLPLACLSFGIFTLLFHAGAFLHDSVRADTVRVASARVEEIPPTPTVYTAQSVVLLEPTVILAFASPTVSPTSVPKLILKPTLTPVPEVRVVKSSPTPMATFIPTSFPKVTPTVVPSVIPSTAVNAAVNLSTNGGMDPEKLFSMANAHRASIGLAALVKDERTCSLAAARAPEIAGEMQAGTLHSGMYGRNLPYWNTENAIAMGPEEVAFNWWLSDYIHRRAIENPEHTVSCVACSGVFCVQEFTSYIPK